MGIDFIATDLSGNSVFGHTAKFIFNDCPDIVSWASPLAGKTNFTPEDIQKYLVSFQDFEKKLVYKPADPEDEDDYDKWVFTDENDQQNGYCLDYWTHQKVLFFIGTLEICVKRGLGGYWSI